MLVSRHYSYAQHFCLSYLHVDCWIVKRGTEEGPAAVSIAGVLVGLAARAHEARVQLEPGPVERGHVVPQHPLAVPRRDVGEADLLQHSLVLAVVI